MFSPTVLVGAGLSRYKRDLRVNAISAVGHTWCVTGMRLRNGLFWTGLSRCKRDLRVNAISAVGHACSVTGMCIGIGPFWTGLSRYKRDLRVDSWRCSCGGGGRGLPTAHVDLAGDCG